MIGYATPGALTWLERLFRERFGLPILLFGDDASGNISLALEGHEGSIAFVTDRDMFCRADSELPCTTWNAGREGWSGSIGDAIPAPGAASLDVPVIAKRASGYEVRFDIPGLCYWVLTRQEEVGRTDLDEHGRFPATASHAYAHGYLTRPVVDEWLHILAQVIQRTWPGVHLREHTFQTMLSHDVDLPSRYGFGGLRPMLRSMAADLLRGERVGTALMAPWIHNVTKNSLHDADPYNTFDWLMRFSEENGLRSAFYFISGRTHPNRDARYDLQEPAIRQLMRRIHARGHEIGLHPSYDTYLSAEALVAEAMNLRRACAEEGIEQQMLGGRMHYLRWRQPYTMRILAAAGLDYDSTLGYADMPGFRCGTCHEYPAFDPVFHQALTLRIRPLIAMDVSVLSAKYMGMGAGEAAHIFKRLKWACERVSGQFTLLWHNSELFNDSRKTMFSGIFLRDRFSRAQESL